jgi:hypothetical protein
MSHSAILLTLLSMPILFTRESTTAQVLPPDPSTAEIGTFLAQASTGAIDPSQLIETLSSPGVCHITSLRELLFLQRATSDATPLQTGASASPRYNPTPAYQVLVKVLENIGSAECYSCLYDAAASNLDGQIRGFCLNSLATRFQSRAKNGTVQPDTRLLYLFLTQASDTLMIMGLMKRVGEIARDGLRNWTAKGGSRPITATLRAAKVSPPAGSRPYWEHWWATRSLKIVWDAELGVFIMPR